MSKFQTNLIQAQESLFFLLKDLTNKSDDEITNLSINFLDQVQKKLSNKSDETLILESLEEVTHNQPIYINGISYISLCEHHMMPFYGNVSIAVFPKKKILGISKFSDIVGHFSNDLTLQEKLNEKIASFIHEILDADGVFVKISAKHLCSDLLNSQNSSKEVMTTYSTGVYELDFSLRNEALLNFS
tara:strand:+ start:1415 stop:1975 length:561 start_codon:yes stop_codon:yes gene_type:complete